MGGRRTGGRVILEEGQLGFLLLESGEASHAAGLPSPLQQPLDCRLALLHLPPPPPCLPLRKLNTLEIPERPHPRPSTVS